MGVRAKDLRSRTENLATGNGGTQTVAAGKHPLDGSPVPAGPANPEPSATGQKILHHGSRDGEGFALVYVCATMEYEIHLGRQKAADQPV